MKYFCKECGAKSLTSKDIIITIDNNGNEILHCPSCYSKETLLNELVSTQDKLTDEY